MPKIQKIQKLQHGEEDVTGETVKDTTDTKAPAWRRGCGGDSNNDKHKTGYKTKKNYRKMKKGN